MIKSRKMDGVCSMGNMRNPIVGKPEGKRTDTWEAYVGR
jgi:hypothetical protein